MGSQFRQDPLREYNCVPSDHIIQINRVAHPVQNGGESKFADSKLSVK